MSQFPALCHCWLCGGGDSEQTLWALDFGAESGKLDQSKSCVQRAAWNELPAKNEIYSLLYQKDKDNTDVPDLPVNATCELLWWV